MKSKSNVDSTMRNSTSAGQENAPGNTPGNAYSPSVPISVYRELAAELQATKAMLDSINSQNQQLSQQNQQFRKEIERLVHSALTLQQIAGIAQQTSQSISPAATPGAIAPGTETIADTVRAQASRTGQRSARPPGAASDSALAPQLVEPEPVANDFFTEQREDLHRPETRSPAKDMGGFWLVITILLIVVTAFGAGFLVVRPLLPNNR